MVDLVTDTLEEWLEGLRLGDAIGSDDYLGISLLRIVILCSSSKLDGDLMRMFPCEDAMSGVW